MRGQHHHKEVKMSEKVIEGAAERRAYLTILSSAGGALAGTQAHVDTAVWHLRRIVELAESIDAVDLRGNYSGKVDQSLLDDVNVIADPAVEKARLAAGKARQALRALERRK
jgi:hypothetical protein